MDPLPVTCSHCPATTGDTSVLGRMTSDAGVDFSMTHGEFRLSVERRCSLYVALHEMAVRCDFSAEMALFRIIEANLVDEAQILVVNTRIKVAQGDDHESLSIRIVA